MTVNVNSQQESLLNDPVLLRKIDQMREKNIGKYLPLPQLVAVGDQSSGKSSLLESLTGISFPRGQELCTRYATQITHRRDDSSYITVSIIPGPHASQTDKESLKLYKRQVKSSVQLLAEFPDIMDEVNTLMGIKTAKNTNGDRTFSEDILKIEKCGPKEDYLTVIDVPGIFRTTTEGVTTAKDQEMVRKMVKDYIKDSRTIILAVLPSNVDVATQEILTLAETYDKAGERTLGILTKPDLVLERSAKLSVCSLLEGRKKPLNLGYFIVRNRGGDQDDDEKDTSSSSLSQREAMFREEPWNSLPDDRVGVSALRERLQELLGQITNREFPKLRADTDRMLKDTEKQLEEFGPARQTTREQQHYLMGIAEKFQILVRAALDADYSTHTAFEDNELRLITAVVNTADRFSKDFADASRTYRFESEVTDPTIPAPVAVQIRTKPQHLDNDETNSELSSGDTDRSTSETFPDLKNIVIPEEPVAPPMTGIMTWIESVYLRSRGIELGTFSPTVLASAFREQSEKWEPMTKQYISKVIIDVHKFVSKTLEIVCTDESVRQKLTYAIMDELVSRYKDGMNQAKFLADAERQLKPYTLNRYFSSSFQKSQGARIAKLLQPHTRKEYNTGKFVVDFDAISTTVSSKSNKDRDIQNIHDILEAYYEVAMKRFVDNVFQQAVDYKLLSGPNSPLRLFSGQWVIHLSDEELASVARESRMTRDRREKLKRKIKDLKDAVEILHSC